MMISGSITGDRTHPFRTRLLRGDRLNGVIVSLPSPEVAEILSMSGLDWLFIDMEHGGISVAVLGDLLRAAQPRTPCAVRIPAIDEAWIKRCLDAGADGLIVPMVRTPEAAERAVRWSKYPPRGTRSVGIARAHGYGADFAGYIERADDEIAVILQIEHIDAVDRIDAILAVEGVDAVFIGPYDLSASMGRTGRVADPEVVAAIGRIRDACHAAGMPTGIFAPSVDAARSHALAGDTLLALGIDALMLSNSAAGIVAALS